MRLPLFLFVLLIFNSSLAQSSVDTIELYNSVLTKKRTTFNSTGEIVGEMYFHKNGQVQTKYLLKNGKRIQWVAYDTSGVKLSEWIDPEPAKLERIRLRNLVFVSTLIVVLGLMTLLARMNYHRTYIALLCTVAIFPFVAFLSERLPFPDSDNMILQIIIASMLVIFPCLLLILSISNFFRKTSVPIVMTIFSLVVSLGFILIFGMLFNMTGAGMIG